MKSAVINTSGFVTSVIDNLKDKMSYFKHLFNILPLKMKLQKIKIKGQYEIR